MVVIVFTQVVMRYFLRLPFTWGEELARFLQIWLTFLGAVFAFCLGGHTAISMLRDRLPPGAQKAVQALIGTGVGAFFSVLLIKGTALVRLVWSDRSPAMSLPIGLVYLVLPLASGLILVVLIRDLLRLFRPGTSAQERLR